MRRYSIAAKANPPIALSLELRQRISEILNADDVLGATPYYAVSRVITKSLVMLHKEFPGDQFDFALYGPEFEPINHESTIDNESPTFIFELQQKLDRTNAWHILGLWVIEVRQMEN